jgi:hypothetical protein
MKKGTEKTKMVISLSGGGELVFVAGRLTDAKYASLANTAKCQLISIIWSALITKLNLTTK